MGIKLFEEGLALLNKKDYKKALDKFSDAMAQTDNLQLIAKCKSYIAICKEKLKDKKEKIGEIDYGYAVYLLNIGEYGKSKEVLENIFKKDKNKNDTYFYLYAIAEAGENNKINAEKYLKKAIGLNPSIVHLASKEPLLKHMVSKTPEK